ncbi:MAG: hypothetical protein HY674_04485 [Chloroflexi bacterium]|nr:hypothetical protein [Chloroflexota bacterium]
MNAKALLRWVRRHPGMFTALLLWWPAAAKADQVEMENGDRYVGKVLLVDDKEVRLQSEIHGPMRLPRAKVVLISFREKAAAAKAAPPQPSAGKPVTAEALPQNPINGLDPKLLKQVEQEILGGAGPEANSMFTDLMKGYMSGAITVEDIQARARTSLTELKSLKNDLGEEVGPLLDGYIAILEKFVNESKESSPDKAAGKATSGDKPKAGVEKKKPQ